MPNIGLVLREEITRLSKRASRAELAAMKKASAQYRRHIAALKRDVAQLARQIAVLKRNGASSGAPAPTGTAGTQLRFVAKGLKSQRARLGLSQAEFGRLVGVSAQSIYQWERGATRPRAAQLASLAALRAIGKREARERLKRPASSSSRKRAKRR